MSVFISYASRDEEAAKGLAVDLEQAKLVVWFDKDLYGGDPWWQAILEQIRECTVFVLALSNNSVRSRPCRAEIEYARALGIPILPVRIGPVDNLLATPVADLQVIDYTERTASSGINLVASVHDRMRMRAALPSPLPEPPPVPFEYLIRLGRAIEARSMAPEDQAAVLAQLKQGLRGEDDDRARELAKIHLRNLRGRSDIVYNVATEIDTLIGEAARPPERNVVKPGWYPDPARPGSERYWDGALWTLTTRSRSYAPGDPPPGQVAVGADHAPAAKLRRRPVLSIIAFAIALLTPLLMLSVTRSGGRLGVVLVVGAGAIVCGLVAALRREKPGRAALIVAIVVTVACALIAPTFR